MKSKKEEEKQILNILLEHDKNLSTYKIKENVESPDFILISGNEVIGIEITKIITKNLGIKSNPPALSSYADKVKNGLKKILDKNKIGPLHISLHLSMVPRMLKVNRDNLTIKIYLLILENMPTDGNHISLRNDFNDLENFPEEISYLQILKMNSLRENFVTVPLTGWVQEDFDDQIQNEIDRKEKKIKMYKTKAEKLWLLVVADWKSEGSFFDPSDRTLSRVYKSKFNRVYFINSFNRTINRLNITKE
ncbi:hypothetical protein ACFLQ4_02000 [Bacteroidota bacterium]